MLCRLGERAWSLVGEWFGVRIRHESRDSVDAPQLRTPPLLPIQSLLLPHEHFFSPMTSPLHTPACKLTNMRAAGEVAHPLFSLPLFVPGQLLAGRESE